MAFVKLVTNRHKRCKPENRVWYITEAMSCDTETSWNHDDKNPKCWITSIQVFFQNEYKLFRKPTEFIKYLLDIIEKYNLNPQKRLKILFHNGSYDLSYLMGFFQLYLPWKDDISVLNDRHKIISYRQGGIEILDTYILSSQSLQKWGESLNISNKKKVGLYDYSKIIYQDTELTEEEKTYDKFDVLALDECFKKQLELYDDDISTVPMTATGYIRRVFRTNAQKNRPYITMFRNNTLDDLTYTMSVRAFSGGFTHGNRFKRDIVKARIGHRDFRSHYPTQLRCYPLPFGKPSVVYNANKVLDCTRRITVKEVLDLYPKYSSLVKIIIEKAELKNKKITMPFLQKSKMFNVNNSSKITLDNGRILKFDGYGEIVVDNLTLKILSEQYNIEGMIAIWVTFENMYLPKCLAKTIDEYFIGKSDNKITLAEIEETLGEFSEEAFSARNKLRISKNGLNGTYGMFAENPIHKQYNVDYTQIGKIDDIFAPIINEKSISEQLDDFYGNTNSFLPYQIAWAITSLARYELYEYIKVIGYENCLYCDTDSIFYIKTEKIEENIEKLNAKKHKNAEKLGAFITDKKGRKIYYDVFEKESDLIAFKQLHAKCYGFITEKSEFKATIAGVPERTIIGMNGEKPIYLRREEELGGITKEMKLKGEDKFDVYEALDNIKDEFKFYVNTGSTSKYLVELPHIEIIDGHEIETSGGCIISTPDSKEISETDLDDYEYEVRRSTI